MLKLCRFSVAKWLMRSLTTLEVTGLRPTLAIFYEIVSQIETFSSAEDVE
jgi:hypothetical protein